jgi:hypothetical protein
LPPQPVLDLPDKFFFAFFVAGIVEPRLNLSHPRAQCVLTRC